MPPHSLTNSSAQPTSRPSRLGVVSVAGVLAALAGLGVVVRLAAAPPRFPGAGRAMPRIPAPPRDPASLLRDLGVGSVTWYLCLAAVPVLWWIVYRVPVTQARPWRAAGLQLAAVAWLILLATVVLYVATYRLSPMAPGFFAYLPVALRSAALPILGLAALLNALEARRRAVHDAIEAQRLRAELAESRLEAVTSQLQPHFLFNTLQSISTLIHKDPVAADAMLAKLSDLLRDVLRRSRHVLVSLDEELRMTQTYLDLARLRYGDRLRVSIEVDDGARRAAVPVMLLQPLIENALKHGVGQRAAGGFVGVAANREGDRLRLVVSDDGVGLDASREDGEGTGLANTRERLRHAFGDNQSLELAPRTGGGVSVTIQMPVQPMERGSA